MDEIIRRKDCQFYGWKCVGICENMNVLWNQVTSSLIFVEKYDFCSYTKPKEENK